LGILISLEEDIDITLNSYEEYKEIKIKLGEIEIKLGKEDAVY